MTDDNTYTDRRTVLRTTASIVPLALAGCSSTASDDGADDAGDTIEPTTTDDLADDEWVSIEDDAWTEWDEYTEGVEVLVRNARDVPLDIFVTAKFYDAEDVQIGDASRHASDVSPDAKAKLKLAYVGDERPERYDLSWEAYEA